MSIITQVEVYVRSKYASEFWRDFPYHNLDHTVSVVDLCIEISNALKLSSKSCELLTIAAWFHDLGYSLSYTQHESASKILASEFLTKYAYDETNIQIILELIESTRVDYTDQKNILEEVLFDADRGSIGQDNFHKLGNKLRREWIIHDFALFSDHGWNALQVNYIENTKFKTSYSKEKFEAQRLINLNQAKKICLQH